MNHISAVCRGPWQAVHKLEDHEDGQINMVNTDHIICNVKRSSIATLKTSGLYSSLNISHKLDTGSNSNRLPFCIFKILFPKLANKLLSQTKNTNVKNAIKQESSLEHVI